MKATSTEVASRHEQCLVRDEHQQILEQRRLERSVHVERMRQKPSRAHWCCAVAHTIEPFFNYFCTPFFKGKCHTSIVVQYFTQHEQQKFILKVCLGSTSHSINIFSVTSLFFYHLQNRSKLKRLWDHGNAGICVKNTYMASWEKWTRDTHDVYQWIDDPSSNQINYSVSTRK